MKQVHQVHLEVCILGAHYDKYTFHRKSSSYRLLFVHINAKSSSRRKVSMVLHRVCVLAMTLDSLEKLPRGGIIENIEYISTAMHEISRCIQ